MLANNKHWTKAGLGEGGRRGSYKTSSKVMNRRRGFRVCRSNTGMAATYKVIESMGQGQIVSCTKGWPTQLS